jgi:phosphoglycolate phosphatase
MQYHAIIFDLDGTLVDSIEDLADSLNKVLENNNLPTHHIDTYKRLVGSGIKKLVQDALPQEHRNTALQQECTQAMFDIYQANCMNKTKPYAGITELLDALDKRQIRYAVLSNKADEFSKKIVASLFPQRNFAFVVGVTDEASKKPNPQNALKMSKEFGHHPEEIVFVGDSGIDMQTANNAGMCAIGALWGFKSKEELKQNKANHTIEHPIDLLKVLSIG